MYLQLSPNALGLGAKEALRGLRAFLVHGT